jgi:hypothetical protein
MISKRLALVTATAGVVILFAAAEVLVDEDEIQPGEKVIQRLANPSGPGWEKISPHQKTFLVNSATGETKGAEAMFHFAHEYNAIELMAQAKDPQGNNAAHLAAEGGHLKTLTMLLKFGVDGEGRNEKGHTPLHLVRIRPLYDQCVGVRLTTL